MAKKTGSFEEILKKIDYEMRDEELHKVLEESGLDENEIPDMDSITADIGDFDDDFKIETYTSDLTGNTFTQSEDIKTNIQKINPKVDYRNNDIKISKQLEGKLEKSTADGVELLGWLWKDVERELAYSTCSDEMRKIIAEKLVDLTSLLSKVYEVTKSDVSDDEKKVMLENLVGIGKLDMIPFYAKIQDEIKLQKK